MSPITRTAVSLAGILAAFALVLYLAYGSGGGAGDDPTPSPSAVVRASPTPVPVTPPVTPAISPPPEFWIPAALDGTAVVSMRQGEPIDLPDDIALIVETGCWYCDGPATGLKRVYRNPLGEIVSDVLLDPAALGYVDAEGNSQGLMGLYSTGDGSWIVVGVCSAGYCGHLGFPTEDARTAILESHDGGVTWSEVAELQGAYWVEAGIPGHRGGPNFPAKDGQVIVSGPLPIDGGSYTHAYTNLATGEALTPPPLPSGFSDNNSQSLAVMPGGELLWILDGSRLRAADGTNLLQLGPSPHIVPPLAADSNGTRWAIPWIADFGNAPSPHYLTLTDTNGLIIRTLVSERYISYGPNAHADVLYGNAEVDPEPLRGALGEPPWTFMPVMIILNEATYHPILDPFTGKEFLYGRNRIVAVQRGPFARVANTDGSCLNVRAPAGLDAMIFGCVAEGVLLQITHEHNHVDGVDWAHVVTPDGLQGWAAAEYLEY